MKLIALFLLGIYSTALVALEQNDLDFIYEYDLVRTNVRKKMEDFEVKPMKLDEDEFKYKGQSRETTQWATLKDYEWFDFKLWAKDRDIKDKDLVWKKRIRDLTNAELVGRVLKCVGVCTSYRGSKENLAEFQTNLREGDEFKTDPDSFAWILLIDGSILRVSSKSSVTLQEINLSREKSFVILRVNQGQIQFQSRLMGEFEKLNQPESDLGFNPFQVLQANREYYSIHEYRKMNKDERVRYAIAKHPGYDSQYDKLNQLMKKNDKLFENRDTHFFIYSPNISIEGVNTNVSLFYEPNGVSYFRLDDSYKYFNKKDFRISFNKVYFRGHQNLAEMEPDNKKWYQMDKTGSTISEEKSEKTPLLSASIAFLNRIPSIHLAREIWLEKYSFDFLKAQQTPRELAEMHGYRLWDFTNKEEIKKRLYFVKEYTRRIETTNLISLRGLLQSKKNEDFNPSYYAMSMRKHYNQVRNRYRSEKLKIREMSDTHYYLWTLK
ncbi:MAG: hypothetical protein HON90_07720 [Halobacteriovoraceae bacterium]|jgi:hypothetical protein|nr:hypothetical protein [Halobacteriovoraceae bacterium]